MLKGKWELRNHDGAARYKSAAPVVRKILLKAHAEVVYDGVPNVSTGRERSGRRIAATSSVSRPTWRSQKTARPTRIDLRA